MKAINNFSCSAWSYTQPIKSFLTMRLYVKQQSNTILENNTLAALIPSKVILTLDLQQVHTIVNHPNDQVFGQG